MKDPQRIEDNSHFTSGQNVNTPDGDGKVIECRDTYVLVDLFETETTERFEIEDVSPID